MKLNQTDFLTGPGEGKAVITAGVSANKAENACFLPSWSSDIAKIKKGHVVVKGQLDPFQITAIPGITADQQTSTAAGTLLPLIRRRVDRRQRYYME